MAIPVPLRKVFEYKLSKTDAIQPMIGMRVEVNFAGRSKIGIIVAINNYPELAIEKIKVASRLLDQDPLVGDSMIALVDWMQKYYHAPPGEVWQTVLPTALLKGEQNQLKRQSHWQITQLGLDALKQNKIAKNAVKQQQALQVLADKQSFGGVANEGLSTLGLNRASLQSLAGKQWVKQEYQSLSSIELAVTVNRPQNITLNDQQHNAVESICSDLFKFRAWLLFGVTASGKTEVYLRTIEAVLSEGKQALILVPEIGLTPQTVQRFQQRFNTNIEMLHSGMSEQQRLQAWLKASKGLARIIIGTRSALFVPLLNPGIIIIDEEHDSSFKQQQGLRYSARDIAMVRASIEKIPVVLGSASPSIESLMNVKKKKIERLNLNAKAMNTQPVKFRVIDLKNQPIKHGLSFALIDTIAHHLKNKGQILLFLNRRGYSPVLLCHQCGWSSQCQRCDTHFTYHGHADSYSGSLQCHHCGSSRRAPKQCPDCLCEEMVPVGLGTERLEESIISLFPDARVRRIDRDTTRKKLAMKNFVGEIKSGQVDILIGTQMLAKGHHFPDVTLVAMVDMDGALYSSDFRAPEYAAQLITQVSGRTGRATKQGEVVIQTHLAEHPMLQQIIHSGYATFAETALNERIQAELPPHTFNALFQAEATHLGYAKSFLQDVKKILASRQPDGVYLLGPAPAFYTKKAGKFRYQLYLESKYRLDLHKLLESCLIEIESLKSAGRVKWRMEIDPIGD
ncbi:MAG: primosomal protein N' [Kangiellaceae bacterium]|nr:primosomal protein N' [Kangiellaceae bacterium]